MGKKVLENSRIVMVIVVLSVFSLSGCPKKDRLSSSSAVFTISPPAATMTKTDTPLSLSSQIRSPNGVTVLVGADWSISGTCVSAANLNTSVGDTVIFTAPTGANELCDATITAVAEGNAASAQVAIVAYKPLPTIYEVYSDVIPDSVNTNIFVVPQIAGFLGASNSGYTPEGNYYERATNMVYGQFWGVSLNFDGVSNTFKDLSSFNTVSGELKFSIRLSRAINGFTEVLLVQLEDLSTAGGVSSNSVNFQGFSTSSLEWQEVSIPIQSFSPAINFSQVAVPFSIGPQATLNSPLTFDIDAVRWEP